MFYVIIVSVVVGYIILMVWLIGGTKRDQAKELKELEANYKKKREEQAEEQAEIARASKKASEKRKKELIEKYGEEDGMLIFKRKISEKNYKKKKELIKTTGRLSIQFNWWKPIDGKFELVSIA